MTTVLRTGALAASIAAAVGCSDATDDAPEKVMSRVQWIGRDATHDDGQSELGRRGAVAVVVPARTGPDPILDASVLADMGCVAPVDVFHVCGDWDSLEGPVSDDAERLVATIRRAARGAVGRRVVFVYPSAIRTVATIVEPKIRDLDVVRVEVVPQSFTRDQSQSHTTARFDVFAGGGGTAAEASEYIISTSQWRRADRAQPIGRADPGLRILDEVQGGWPALLTIVLAHSAEEEDIPVLDGDFERDRTWWESRGVLISAGSETRIYAARVEEGIFVGGCAVADETHIGLRFETRDATGAQFGQLNVRVDLVVPTATVHVASGRPMGSRSTSRRCFDGTYRMVSPFEFQVMHHSATEGRRRYFEGVLALPDIEAGGVFVGAALPPLGGLRAFNTQVFPEVATQLIPPLKAR